MAGEGRARPDGVGGIPIEPAFDAGKEIVIVLVVGGESLMQHPLTGGAVEPPDVDQLERRRRRPVAGEGSGVPAHDGEIVALD